MTVTTGGRGTRSSGWSASSSIASAAATLLTNRLESEFARNQLDLIEVQALVDRHHHAQFLETERDDVGAADAEDGGEFRDGDELVDPHQGLFALAFLETPLFLPFPERRLIVPSARRSS